MTGSAQICWLWSGNERVARAIFGILIFKNQKFPSNTVRDKITGKLAI
jgi:hypothetical protein